MITHVVRKKTAGAFSIEKLFNTLYEHLGKSGVCLERIELPFVSTGLLSVLRNVLYVRRQRVRGILHITGDVHYAGLLCSPSKTIVTVHDCVVLQRGTGFKRRVLWLLWFWLPLRLAAAVTVISEQTKREVLDVVGIAADKIRVIPNFVDPAFSFTHRPFAVEKPRILHVGTTANKNLPRVIEALRNVPCTLVIVGELSQPILEQLRQSAIFFENHFGVTHNEMVGLYHKSDIISFPSTYEGFGMPILEGQAVGRPVLTSDLEPMRSVAGRDGAVLVDPESTMAIRNGILAIINDRSLRDRLTAAGRENCRTYAIEPVAAMYRELYDGLLQRT